MCMSTETPYRGAFLSPYAGGTLHIQRGLYETHGFITKPQNRGALYTHMYSSVFLPQIQGVFREALIQRLLVKSPYRGGLAQTEGTLYIHVHILVFIFLQILECFSKPLGLCTYIGGFAKFLGLYTCLRLFSRATRGFAHNEWGFSQIEGVFMKPVYIGDFAYVYAHFSLFFYRYWGSGGKVTKYFARNCMKCTDLHRKITFLTVHPNRCGGCQVPKTFFARNSMNCADLHRMIIFLTPTPIGVGSSTQKYLLGFAWSLQLCV